MENADENIVKELVKVDFHIHTISTLKDSYFDFDINVLNQYINEMEIDCIAITNHNVFDKKQYEEIKELYGIK